MSQEVFEIRQDGKSSWRCCDFTSGTMSLDQVTLEPALGSLDDAVERLLATESFSNSEDRSRERERLLGFYLDLDQYLDGSLILDLDRVAQSLGNLSMPLQAYAIDLVPAELSFLEDLIEAIHMERTGDTSWRVSARALADAPERESLHSKLFSTSPETRTLITHPDVDPREARALLGALSYFDILANSTELKNDAELELLK